MNKTYDDNLIDHNIERLIYIHYAASANNIYHKPNNIYEYLGISTGLFWGMPPNSYNIIKNIYGNENILECFASPYNHYFDKYCSLLAEDGSVGNFFTTSYYTNYSVFVVNPPFTHSIIIKTIFHLFNYVNAIQHLKIYLFLPMWQDLINFIQILFDGPTIYYIENSYAYDFKNKKMIFNKIKQCVILISKVVTNMDHMVLKAVAYNMSKESISNTKRSLLSTRVV